MFLSACLTNIQCATTLTLVFVYTTDPICKMNSVLEWKKTLDSLHVGRNIKRIDKQMKVICKAVSVLVNHVGQCMECKRKQSF